MFLVQVRILVTHGIAFLPQCDVIVVMVDGQITEVGSYTELINNDGAFAQFLHTYKGADENADAKENDLQGIEIHVQVQCVGQESMVNKHSSLLILSLSLSPLLLTLS